MRSEMSEQDRRETSSCESKIVKKDSNKIGKIFRKSDDITLKRNGVVSVILKH
jgi:hypothetical protein